MCVELLVTLGSNSSWTVFSCMEIDEHFNIYSQMVVQNCFIQYWFTQYELTLVVWITIDVDFLYNQIDRGTIMKTQKVDIGVYMLIKHIITKQYDVAWRHTSMYETLALLMLRVLIMLGSLWMCGYYMFIIQVCYVLIVFFALFSC